LAGSCESLNRRTYQYSRKLKENAFYFSLIFGAVEAINIKKVYATSTRFTFLIKI